MAVTQKLERLTFNGKEEDFGYFEAQFEARMHLLKLSDALLDKIEVPVAVQDENETARATRLAAETNRSELRHKVWCELVQCIDKRTFMFIRSHKPDGMRAWQTLRQHFRSSERPRLQATMTKLTSLSMNAGEKIQDYLARAEDLQLDLQEVGEEISASMFMAMVLKGLPSDFSGIVTVLNHGEKKSYDEVKQQLINFASTRENTNINGSFHSKEGKGIKCFKCGRMGHRQSECRSMGQRQETRTCRNCGKQGHIQRDCRSAQNVRKCENCGKGNHTTEQCWSGKNRNNRGTDGVMHKSSGNHAMENTNDIDSLYAFTSENEEIIELLIDSGCTGYMIKDKMLFKELDENYK